MPIMKHHLKMVAFHAISLEGVNPNFASSCNMPHFSISFPENSIFDLISTRWAPTIQLYKLDETNPWSIWPTFPKVGLTVLPRHFADAFWGHFFPRTDMPQAPWHLVCEKKILRGERTQYPKEIGPGGGGSLEDVFPLLRMRLAS